MNLWSSGDTKFVEIRFHFYLFGTFGLPASPYAYGTENHDRAGYRELFTFR
jgi:hypothetical protein